MTVVLGRGDSLATGEGVGSESHAITTVSCDEPGCPARVVLPGTKVSVYLKLRGWQEISDRTYCPDHHHPIGIEGAAREISSPAAVGVQAAPAVLSPTVHFTAAESTATARAPRSPRKQVWLVATLPLVGMMIALGILWVFLRMLSDEFSLALNAQVEFEQKMQIIHPHCDRGWTSFSCSGLYPSDPPKSIKYTCDRADCAIEFGK